MASVNNSNTAMAVAASALTAQSARMKIIAENLANADSTARTAGGDPYQRQMPLFAPTAVDGGQGVKMSKVTKDPAPFKTAYEPGHPGADGNGYVKMPNVDPLIEALDMREAQRAYEANLSVIETARAMTQSTLELLKK